jgi:CCR4-NOT complex subunit CAF16
MGYDWLLILGCVTMTLEDREQDRGQDREQDREQGNAIEVRGLTFRYPRSNAPVFADLSLAVPRAARCLLLGANGVGKSTLLRLVAGRHMIAPEIISVLGRPAFHDTSLSSDLAFLGGPFPFSADITVAEILRARPDVEPSRRARVLDILEVDPAWRMHQVSDGQRRRVQLLLDLERRLQVILLDEVTAELDVLSRADLLRFLREESEGAEGTGATIVYASHVLEGLAGWATHLAFLSPGRLRCFGPIKTVIGAGESLAGLCERWMREDRRAAAIAV